MNFGVFAWPFRGLICMFTPMSDFYSHRIEIIHGDITTQAVDAVVNAANSSLMGGGGVDGAIHRAGGPQILEACRKIVAQQGGCNTGHAVITTAGRMPARYVIHTVGPVWHGGHHNEESLLTLCYRNSLKIALESSCATIAFPNISTGIYGFPKDKAAAIAFQTVRAVLVSEPAIEKVLFVCFDRENFDLLQREAGK